MLNRVFVVFLVMVLVAMVAIGAVASTLLKSEGGNFALERLTDAAGLVYQEIASGMAPDEAARTAAQIFSSNGHVVRMTLIQRDGTVIADTGADPAGLDNHLTRPEVAGALETGGTAWDTRYSATLHMDMMYFARYDAGKALVIRSSLPLSELQSTTTALDLRILIVSVVILLLFLLVGLLSIRIVSRPFTEMKAAALAITSGRYDLRVRRILGDRSEIGRLTSAFNGMADRLEASVADLEDKTYRMDAILDAMDTPLFAVDPQMAVTFRNAEAKRRYGGESEDGEVGRPMIFFVRSRAVEDFVKESMKAMKRNAMEWRQETDDGVRIWRVAVSPLQGRDGGAIVVFHDITETMRLQRIRSDFAANVTHELSTPLTAIRGFIETLRGGAVKNPALADRFLDIIDLEAERLHRLIDDILTLSEIEGGRAEAEPVPFDLNERIDRTVVLLEESAAKRGVHLVAGPPRVGSDDGGAMEESEEPGRFEVRADPDRIGQLLMNLLDNAIKYNREDGTVWAWAERERDGRTRIHVKDTGIGIEEEQKARIFERFYRVDAGRSRESGGTGLGLSIVKHIALLYKGNVRVESSPGEGSEFIATLDI